MRNVQYENSFEEKKKKSEAFSHLVQIYISTNIIIYERVCLYGCMDMALFGWIY